MHRVLPTFAILLGLVAGATAAPPQKPTADPKSLQVPPEELSKARDLVQKLGSEAFVERECAERDLAAMGRLARLALLDGLNRDPDPEVRSRCRVLLPRANAEELAARLDSFLADTEGKYEHDLPGWHRLRATVRGEWTVMGWTFAARPGADRAARELFIEFVKAPGGRQLLTALGGPPGELGQLVATRKTELYQAKYPRVANVVPRNPGVAEVAVVAFAESQVHSRLVPRSTVLTTVLISSGIAEVVRGSDDRALAMRAVLTAWFDTRIDAVELSGAMSVATNMKFDDASARLAGRIMSTVGVSPVYKNQALMTLVRLKADGKLTAADHLSALEKAFTDTGALTTTIKFVNGAQVRESVEVRDGALAVALVLTDQDPGAYGFEAYPKNTTGTFSPAWAKIDETKRKEAFAKWKAWREKNP